MEHNACSSLLMSCADESNADSTEMTRQERREELKKRKLGSKRHFIVHCVFYCNAIHALAHKVTIGHTTMVMWTLR